MDAVRRVVRVEDDLNDAFSVAHVNEDKATVVAAAVDPSCQRNRLANMFGAHVAAANSLKQVCPLEIASVEKLYRLGRQITGFKGRPENRRG